MFAARGKGEVKLKGGRGGGEGERRVGTYRKETIKLYS